MIKSILLIWISKKIKKENLVKSLLDIDVSSYYTR